MSRTLLYRCESCLEATIERSFDTSHVMKRCPECSAFGRFINQAIIDRFEAYEATPPENFEWGRLAKPEKLLVAERLARTDRTIEDVSIVDLRDADGE